MHCATNQINSIGTARQRFWLFCLCFVSFYLFFLPSTAWAQAADYGDYGEAFTSFQNFLTTVAAYIDLVLAPGSNAAQFIEAFFYAFAFYRISFAIAGWMMFDNLPGLVAAVLLVAVVRIMLDFYDPLTSLLLSWAGDFAGSIQQPITGNGDVFFVVGYLTNILDSISLPSITIFNAVSALMAIITLAALTFLLSVLAFFAVAWGVYGFALAKLIGWMFLPFILIERTAALFDGWIKFMLGFLFYMVIARVNLVLVLILFTTYLNLPLTSGTAPGVPFVVPVDDFSDLGGLVSLLIISILSLISTGKFAVALAGGVGGFGGALSQAVLSVGLGVSRLGAAAR